jgi:integrase
VVPMCDALARWIDAAPAGPLVQYHGKPVLRLNVGWRAMRRRAGLDDAVVPYSIRHSMATEVHARGVPELELAGFLGHSMPNFVSETQALRVSARVAEPPKALCSWSG